MAEQPTHALTAEDVRSLKTVFIGTNVIFWILAIFLIWIMYSFNKKLTELSQNTSNLMTVTGNLQMDGLQVIEGALEYGMPSEGQRVVYTIVRPQMEYEIYEEEGMQYAPGSGAAPVAPDLDIELEE